MRISILVPTCPANVEDTYTPKAGDRSFVYPVPYDSSDSSSTISSAVTDARSYLHDTLSGGSENAYQYQDEKRYANGSISDSMKTVESNQNGNVAGKSGRVSAAAPLKANKNLYNEHPIGKQKGQDVANGSTVQMINKNRSNTPATVATSNSESESHSDKSPHEDVYNRLVVGTASRRSFSQPDALEFSSDYKRSNKEDLENGHSYRSSRIPDEASWENRMSSNNDSGSTPPRKSGKMVRPATPRAMTFSSDSKRRGEDDFDSGNSYRTTRIPDEASYENSMSSNSDLVSTPPRKSGKMVRSATPKARNGTNIPQESLEKIACAAETMENDFFWMFGSLKYLVLGPSSRGGGKKGSFEDGEEVDAELSSVPITRLSADLRKQRLRNQVLSHERDTVNKENNELREQLLARERVLREMGKKLEELEKKKKRAEDAELEKSEKIAGMMNELIDIQMEVSSFLS